MPRIHVLLLTLYYYFLDYLGEHGWGRGAEGGGPSGFLAEQEVGVGLSPMTLRS